MRQCTLSVEDRANHALEGLFKCARQQPRLIGRSFALDGEPVGARSDGERTLGFGFAQKAITQAPSS